VLGVGLELVTRYGGGEPAERAARSQAPKRVALQFHARRTVTFDHRLFSMRAVPPGAPGASR
jgi:hypothetical protein